MLGDAMAECGHVPAFLSEFRPRFVRVRVVCCVPYLVLRGHLRLGHHEIRLGLQCLAAVPIAPARGPRPSTAIVRSS